MTRTRVFVVGLFFLCATLAGCAGDNPAESRVPELLSIEIVPNPVDLYEFTTVIVGFSDHDGDMEEPTVHLSIETEDEQVIDVPVKDVEVSDDIVNGTVTFTVEVLDGYEGNCVVTIADEAGNVSEPIEEFLFVNQPAV
jgi:hypothetical protein